MARPGFPPITDDEVIDAARREADALAATLERVGWMRCDDMRPDEFTQNPGDPPWQRITVFTAIDPEDSLDPMRSEEWCRQFALPLPPQRAPRRPAAPRAPRRKPTPPGRERPMPARRFASDPAGDLARHNAGALASNLVGADATSQARTLLQLLANRTTTKPPTRAPAFTPPRPRDQADAVIATDTTLRALDLYDARTKTEPDPTGANKVGRDTVRTAADLLGFVPNPVAQLGAKVAKLGTRIAEQPKPAPLPEEELKEIIKQQLMIDYLEDYQPQPQPAREPDPHEFDPASIANEAVKDARESHDFDTGAAENTGGVGGDDTA